jgi:hypothetical protein
MWRTLRSAIESWGTTVRLIVAVFGLAVIWCGVETFCVMVLRR